jgi:hypothetical protein
LPDLEQRLAEIERRLAALEMDSHPPVDLAPAIREIVLQMREDLC